MIINNLRDLKKAYQNPFSKNGSPQHFKTVTSEMLCHTCVYNSYQYIVSSIKNKDNDMWRVEKLVHLWLKGRHCSICGAYLTPINHK